MNINDLIHQLPKEPPKEMQLWASAFDSDMGGNILLFRRESLEIVPPLQRTMTDEEWKAHEQKTYRRWGAVCNCTCCGEEFETGWASYPKTGVKGIRITMGDNGFFPGYVEPGADESIEVAEGDTVICPYCECEVRLVAASSIPSGRTWQVLVGNIQTIGEYTVILTWLYRRQLHNTGFFQSDIRPARAIAITKRGALRRFDHVRVCSYGSTYDLPCWEPVANTGDDPFLMLYYNCDACNHKQVGGEMWPKVPNLAGTTGEKTGLTEYIKKGGAWPVAYLKIWKNWPYVENLMKSGFAGKLVQDINAQVSGHLQYGHRSDRVHISWCDLSESRPSQMLGMTKPEMATLSQKWTVSKLEEWYQYYTHSARMTATQFDQCLDRIGLEAMQTINAYGEELADERWVEKAVRYVAKQQGMTARAAAELLTDLWDMLEEESNGRIITDEELWPRDLRAAHDRLADERNIKKSAEEDARVSAGFRAIVDKYGVLEWTDGELCIRLPRALSDLKMEGATLCHCVGGYGNSHIAERTVVFFIRHYRRPERSYYTTDYNLLQEPRRNQLHGYGNERHGEHKQHRHTIPKKVTAFLDRWEREVLYPWYQKQISVATKTKKAKRSA